VKPDSRWDFERLARTLAGRAIGLVFGGGGARGFAHLGVWRALEELNVPVDFVGGTSIGSIPAAGFAMRLTAQRATEISKQRFASVLDPTLPLVSLLAGRRIDSQIKGFFGERQIEDLPLPFFCIATNLTASEEMVHRSGSVSAAVRSSISIPGVLPPVAHQGHLLVDGGLINNVPADVMKGLVQGGPVIAVDVTPEVDLRQFDDLPHVLSGWGVLWDRVNPLRNAPNVPYILNVLTRSTVVASAAAKQVSAGDGGLYLRLPLDEWGMFDFASVEAIAERGYETSRDSIRDWWEQR
jgi:predicted acylesterase/phospholipase RssA